MSYQSTLGGRGWNEVKPRSEKLRGFASGSNPGHPAYWIICLLVTMLTLGCDGKEKIAGSAGSAGPSLDSKNADERAAAARDAAKKYGAEP